MLFHPKFQALVSLLLCVVVESDHVVEDFPHIGYRRPLYMSFNDDEPVKHILKSTLNLQPVYECTYDIRKKYDPNEDTLIFEKFATKYVECYADKIIQGKRQWTDLYGKHDELKKSKYNGLYVHLAMNDVQFSREELTSKNVDVSARVIALNSDSTTEVTSTITNTVDTETNVETESTHSWKTEGKMEIGAKDPITESSASVKMSMFSGGSSSSSKGNGTKNSFTLTDASVVPGGKTGRMLWTKTKKEVEMEWKSYIEVSGWMSAKVDNKIYFVPVGDMTYVYGEYMKRLGPNKLGVTTSGTMTMSDTIVTETTVDEYDKKKTSDAKDLCPKNLQNYTLSRRR